MNQYPPEMPNPSLKAPLYKDIAPENMSFEEALDDIAQVLSNNYNLQVD